MSDLEWFPAVLTGGLVDSRAIPEPADLQTLENVSLFRGRFALRAPASATCRLLDENGANVDNVLAIAYHAGSLYAVAFKGGAVNKTYLYRLDVSGTAEGGGATASPTDTIWTGASVPRVNMVPFEGGSASAGVNRLFIADYTEAHATKYWDSDGDAIVAVQEDFDDNGTKEDLYHRLIFSYASHMFGTGFLQSGVTAQELLRISQPGLIPATEPGAVNHTSREWWYSDFRRVGRRGEAMTAAVEAGSAMLLCKRREIYALFGYDIATFQLRQVSSKTGAIGPHAVESLPDGRAAVWGDRGLYLVSPEQAVDIGAPIRGRITGVAKSEDTTLAYSPDDGLLYCLVSLDGSAPASRLAWDVFAERWIDQGTWKAVEDTQVGLDLFTDSNGTALESHDPDLGANWAQPSSGGTLQIQSNKAQQMTAPFGGRRHARFISVDFTEKAYTVYADVEPAVTGTNNPECGIYVRGNQYMVNPSVDAVNFIKCYNIQFLNYVSSGVYLFSIRTEGHADDTLHSANLALPDLGTIGRRLVATVDETGPTLTVEIQPLGGGAAEFTLGPYTLAQADSSTQRYVGIKYGGSSIARKWDNYTVDVEPSLTPPDLKVNQVKMIPDDTLPGPGAAPSSLVATTASDTEIELAWTNGDTAVDTITEVHRSTSSSFTISESTLVTTVSSGTVAYSDTGRTAEITYYYQVRHLRNGQYSAASNEDSAKAAVATPTVNQTLALATGVTVRVTNNASGADLVLERRLTSGATWSTVTTLTNQSTGVITHDDETTSCGTEYTYRWKATRSGSTDSPYSNEASRVACEAVPSLTSADFTATIEASCPVAANVGLNWRGADLKASDTVKIYRNSDGAGYTERATVPAQDESYSDFWGKRSGGTATSLRYKFELYDAGVSLVDTEEPAAKNYDTDSFDCPEP